MRASTAARKSAEDPELSEFPALKSGQSMALYASPAARKSAEDPELSEFLPLKSGQTIALYASSAARKCVFLIHAFSMD